MNLFIINSMTKKLSVCLVLAADCVSELCCSDACFWTKKFLLVFSPHLSKFQCNPFVCWQTTRIAHDVPCLPYIRISNVNYSATIGLKKIPSLLVPVYVGFLTTIPCLSTFPHVLLDVVAQYM